MSNSVIPQADIGALGLRGLSAFSAVLEACSADNVAPAALIQLSALGDSFLTSGPHAASVPDYLQRCSSVTIDRLSLSIGWLKGDAASYMATSTGGQAISLLCLCVFELYNSREAGKILHGLSRKLLPYSKAVSSMSQMADVGKCLRGKLQPIGFGNILAREVLKIHKVFEQLNVQTTGACLLALPSPEFLIEFFEKVSRALLENQTLLRVTGSQGLGYLLAIIVTMFPEDTTVIVDRLLLFEGPRTSIVMEFNSSGDSDRCSNLEFESKLDPTSSCMVPIQIHSNKNSIEYPRCSFRWKNWAKDCLQIDLLVLGVSCPSNVLSACCGLLQHLPTYFPDVVANNHSTPFPEDGIRHIFNSKSKRFITCCRDVLDVDIKFLDAEIDTIKAFGTLVQECQIAFESLKCTCYDCEFDLGWPSADRQKKRCSKWRAWDSIGATLNNVFISYFIDSGSDATIRAPVDYVTTNLIPSILIDQFLFPQGQSSTKLSCEYFNEEIQRTLLNSVDGLVVSSFASTLFPKAIYNLDFVYQYNAFTFDLLDGRMIFDGRYHKVLRATGHRRTIAETHIVRHIDQLVPSSAGVHDSLMLSISEEFDFLRLHTSIRRDGVEAKVNLKDIIVASYGVKDTKACSHPMTTPLDKIHKVRAVTTSVISPCLLHKEEPRLVSVVLTKDNSVARLLSCVRGAILLELKDCCLNCAFEQLPSYTGSSLDKKTRYRFHSTRDVLLIC